MLNLNGITVTVDGQELCVTHVTTDYVLGRYRFQIEAELLPSFFLQQEIQPVQSQTTEMVENLRAIEKDLR